jgi:hypothetical protein
MTDTIKVHIVKYPEGANLVMSTRQRELERLIAGIDEEIRDTRRDIKEADTVGDGEVIRAAQQNIAALQDERQQAQDSREGDDRRR